MPARLPRFAEATDDAEATTTPKRPATRKRPTTTGKLRRRRSYDGAEATDDAEAPDDAEATDGAEATEDTEATRRRQSDRRRRSYQTTHCACRTILSPGLHANAAANSGRFDIGPSTRKCGGECGSVCARTRATSGRTLVHHDCAM